MFKRTSSSERVASINYVTDPNFLILTNSLTSRSILAPGSGIKVYCTITLVLDTLQSKNASFNASGKNPPDSTIEILSSAILKVALKNGIFPFINRFSFARYILNVRMSAVGSAVASTCSYSFC